MEKVCIIVNERACSSVVALHPLNNTVSVDCHIMAGGDDPRKDQHKQCQQQEKYNRVRELHFFLFRAFHDFLLLVFLFGNCWIDGKPWTKSKVNRIELK